MIFHRPGNSDISIPASNINHIEFGGFWHGQATSVIHTKTKRQHEVLGDMDALDKRIEASMGKAEEAKR